MEKIEIFLRLSKPEDNAVPYISFRSIGYIFFKMNKLSAKAYVKLLSSGLVDNRSAKSGVKKILMFEAWET